MKPKELSELLARAYKAGLKVLVTSPPGCGKSDIIEAVAAAINFDLVLTHPAVSDPTDYKGMPAVLQTNGMTCAEFLPFGDLRRLIEAKKETVCFLDDLGQASPAVQAAIMQLILARRVNGHRISDKVVFCGATNDVSHMAGVSGLIEPVKSRWDTIVGLDVVAVDPKGGEDWCKWAMANGMPPELVAFIRFKPTMLHDFKPTRELKNSPCPRTVASVGRWYNAGERSSDVFKGAAGEAFAIEFKGFLALYSELPSMDEILMNPDEAPVPTKVAAKYAVSSGLAYRATPQNVERVIRYMSRMDKEFEVCCVRDASRRDPNINRTQACIQWFTANTGVV